MQDKLDKLKKAFNEIFPNVDFCHVASSAFKTADDYFETHKNLYDQRDFATDVSVKHQSIEDLEFRMSVKIFDHDLVKDTIEHFLGDIGYYPEDNSLKIKQLKDKGFEFDVQSDDEHTLDFNMNFDVLSNMTLEEFRDLNSDFTNILDEVKSHIESEVNLEYDENSELEDIFKNFSNVNRDSLAYWTVYFEPRVFDENLAHRLNLVPFEYDSMELLALGGSGMDLSPRLDAYQAISDNTIPAGSTFISQPEYAKSVVGEDVYEEVLKAAGANIIKLHAELK